VSPMKCSVFIAISLDRFIARPDGSIDWLTAAGDHESVEDYGYQEFFDRMDALVMGSKTYEKVLSFGRWPYGDKPVVVLSSRRLEISEELMTAIEVLAAPPREIVRRLADRGLRHLPADIHLRHISTRAYPNGLVQSRYVIS